MNKDTIKKYETRYFTDISRYLNVHQLASLIQYGAATESNEPVFREVKEDEESGEIVVEVFGGSEFVVRCERK